MSIFLGLEQSLQEAGVQYPIAFWRPKTAADCARVVDAIFDVVERNWRESPRLKSKDPSQENWRFSKQLKIADHNASPEITLQKRIADIGGPLWANEVPTASGLWDGHADRRRNVDLVRCVGARDFQLIELKVASNSPMEATVQALGYGVLYLQARVRYPPYLIERHSILRAKRVVVAVLAPKEFYAGFAEPELQESWNQAFQQLSRRLDPKLEAGFQYLVFPDHHVWPTTDDELKRSLAGIGPLFNPRGRVEPT